MIRGLQLASLGDLEVLLSRLLSKVLLLSGKIVLTIRSRKRVLSDLEIKSIGCPSKKESIGW